MRRVAAAGALAAAGLWLLAPVARAAGPGDAESDAVDGTSALHQLADARGHHSDLLRDRFDLPAAHGVLFIIEPENAITAADADAIVRWVGDGGVLVYASEGANPGLETALGIGRAGSDSVFEDQAFAATPLLAGVGSVHTGSALPFSPPDSNQATFLRSAVTDAPVGIEGALGKGQFFAIATSTPIDNAHLGTQDSGRLAADLLAAAGPTALVTFDQYHHAGGAGASSSLAWVGTPWGLAIVLEILLVFGLLAVRGRAFGPLIPLRPAADPSSAEFTTAVGAMLRRARARRQTVGRLLFATRAAIAEQVGIRGGVDPERLDAILRRRSPALADALARATASASAVADERSLAHAAAQLHRLAHPRLGAVAGDDQDQNRRRS